MSGNDDLVREVKVSASPETIFPYFTDVEKMLKWKGTEATLEPVQGGTYLVKVSGKYTARGEYVEIDPPRRVVFTWGWDDNPLVPPGSSTVEITLEPHGDHTIVRLTHRGLPSAQEQASHGQGWDHFLSRLAVAASGGDPGPDVMEGA